MSQVFADGGFVLDTPSDIEMWVFTSRLFQLALEINTGMKAARGSVLADCQRRGYTDKRTKKGALKQMVATCQEVRGSDWQIPATVAAALA